MSKSTENEIESYWILAAECLAYTMEKMLEYKSVPEGHPCVVSRYKQREDIRNFIKDKRVPANVKQRFKNVEIELEKQVAEEDLKEADNLLKTRALQIMAEMHSEWGNVATKQEYGTELISRLFPNDPEMQKQVLAGYMEDNRFD